MAQDNLPGIEVTEHPEVAREARRYAQLKDKRVAAKNAEDEAKWSLIAAMQEARVHTYRVDRLMVTLEPGQDKILLRKLKTDEE